MNIIRWEFSKDLDDHYLQSWQELIEQSKVATASGSPSFSKHAELLLDQTKFLYALGFNDKQLVTIMPLMITKKTKYGMRYNCLQLLYHDHFECFVLPNQDKLNLVQVIQSLKHACIKDVRNWHVFIARRWLIQPSPELPHTSLTYQRKAAYLKLSEADNYQQIIPKKQLKNIKRFEKRLSNQGEILMQIATSKAQVVNAIEDFIRLEQSGWKGEKGSAIGCNNKLRDFYTKCWTDFSDTGKAKIITLTINDVAIASAIAFQQGNSLFLHKIAYDESLSSNGPGSILIKKIIENEFNNKRIQTLCFNTNPPWLARWHPKTFAILAIVFTNHNIKGYVLNICNFINSQLKLLKRRLVKQDE